MRRVESVIAAIVIAFAGCGRAATPAGLPDVDTLKCSRPITIATQPSSLPALAQLASKERRPLVGSLVEREHDDNAMNTPHGEGASRVGRELLNELRKASAAACALRTTAAAARAGYVLSSAFTEGVGTHWTNWRLIDKPFDPARPSMLLYARSRGHQTLVGFSFWVRTPNPNGPTGFTGTADRWHRHFGLCFDRTGMLEKESVRNPHACTGTWLNGRDMWMLHAWIVPAHGNVAGIFSPVNPQLCSRAAPDIERCPGVA